MALSPNDQAMLQQIMKVYGVDAATAVQLLSDMKQEGASNVGPITPAQLAIQGRAGMPPMNVNDPNVLKAAATRSTFPSAALPGVGGGPATPAQPAPGTPMTPPASAPPQGPGTVGPSGNRTSPGGEAAVDDARNNATTTAGPNVPGPNPANAPDAPKPAAETQAAGAAAANPAGTPANAGPGGSNVTLGNPNEYTFGMRDTDNLRDWASRVFLQGAKPAVDLNPATNPAGASNPYNAWLMRRYGTSVPVSGLTDMLANGGQLDDVAQKTMGGFAGGGAAGANQGDPMGNLRTLADLDNKIQSNGGQAPDGMDPQRYNYIQGMNNGPGGAEEAKALILAAYQQKYGTMGSDQLMKQLGGLSDEFFGSARPNDNTPFLNYALSKVAGGSLMR